MPTPEEVREQIGEVVAGAGLEHGFTDIEGDEVLLVKTPGGDGANGSTIVVIRCEEVEETSVLVLLSSVILMEIPDEDQTKFKAAALANHLNSMQLLGRWVFYPDKRTIELEYEMRGDSLAPDDIISSIISIGVSGDQEDENLQKILGGKKSLDPPDADSDSEEWA